MALYIYSGIPKTGKTATTTYQAVKHYRKDNSLLMKLFERRTHNVNRVFSNYPILLDKKKKVFAIRTNPNMLCMKYRFPHGSIIILDEFQRYFDSREFKDFPKPLGTFLQHHRHGSIKDIIFTSQHPRRIDNKGRDLSEIFVKHRIFIKIPFIPVFVSYSTEYYEFEDYGKYNHLKNEMKTYDYKNHFRIIYAGNIVGRYDSKYFRVIFDELDPVPEVPFTGLQLTKEEIYSVGITVPVKSPTLKL